MSFGSESAGERVVEFSRYELVSHLRRPGGDVMQTIVAHEEDSSTENSRIGRSLFLNGPKAPKVPSQNITVSRARSRTGQGQAQGGACGGLDRRGRARTRP